MKCSIIIPCKNRLKYLRRVFDKVLRQNYPDYEVIVVDYMCPQGTANYIIQNHKDPRVTVTIADVGPDDWNLSAARNHGYHFATGDVLVFLDADTQLHQKFLHDSVQKLKDGIFLSGRHGARYEVSGCCMVRKSDFEKVKGYNEVVEGWGSEDLDFYRRLTEAGLKNEYFNFGYIKNLPHENSIRNEYHNKRNIYETNSINADRVRTEFKGI